LSSPTVDPRYRDNWVQLSDKRWVDKKGKIHGDDRDSDHGYGPTSREPSPFKGLDEDRPYRELTRYGHVTHHVEAQATEEAIGLSDLLVMSQAALLKYVKPPKEQTPGEGRKRVRESRGLAATVSREVDQRVAFLHMTPDRTDTEQLNSDPEYPDPTRSKPRTKTGRKAPSSSPAPVTEETKSREAVATPFHHTSSAGYQYVPYGCSGRDIRNHTSGQRWRVALQQYPVASRGERGPCHRVGFHACGLGRAPECVRLGTPDPPEERVL
jgi:hypothetical protein